MQKIGILSGNPGSGKTTIAKYLEDDGYVRLSIDDFYQRSDRDLSIKEWFLDKTYLDQAYAKLNAGILREIQSGADIIIETSGIGKRWKGIFEELKERFPNQIISMYLEVSKEEALRRIYARNQEAGSMIVTKERLEAFFEKSQSISQEYDYVINANESAEQVYLNVKELLK